MYLPTNCSSCYSILRMLLNLCYLPQRCNCTSRLPGKGLPGRLAPSKVLLTYGSLSVTWESVLLPHEMAQELDGEHSISIDAQPADVPASPHRSWRSWHIRCSGRNSLPEHACLPYRKTWSQQEVPKRTLFILWEVSDGNAHDKYPPLDLLTCPTGNPCGYSFALPTPGSQQVKCPNQLSSMLTGKGQFADCLFQTAQCVALASRPLHVAELFDAFKTPLDVHSGLWTTIDRAECFGVRDGETLVRWCFPVLVLRTDNVVDFRNEEMRRAILDMQSSKLRALHRRMASVCMKAIELVDAHALSYPLEHVEYILTVMEHVHPFLRYAVMNWRPHFRLAGDSDEALSIKLFYSICSAVRQQPTNHSPPLYTEHEQALERAWEIAATNDLPGLRLICSRSGLHRPEKPVQHAQLPSICGISVLEEQERPGNLPSAPWRTDVELVCSDTSQRHDAESGVFARHAANARRHTDSRVARDSSALWAGRERLWERQEKGPLRVTGPPINACNHVRDSRPKRILSRRRRGSTAKRSVSPKAQACKLCTSRARATSAVAETAVDASSPSRCQLLDV